MTESKRYNDFDNIKLFVKKNKSKEIISHYESFGFSLVFEKENDRYDDIIDLEFERPHNIKNKDELQLLQVYMEETVNGLAKIERNKHTKSLIFALTSSVFALAFIFLGAYLVLKIASLWGLIWGVASVIVGTAIAIVTILFSFSMFKKEKSDFEKIKIKLNKEISQICSDAKSLVGGKKCKK